MGHQQVMPISKQLLFGLLGGLGLAAVILLLGAVQNSLVMSPPQYATQRLLATNDLTEKVSLILLTVLLLPVAEELICRGYIYSQLAEILGSVAAMILASLIYAALHFDVFRLPILFLAGLWLNLVYRKTGTLVPAILAHAVWNAVMLGVALI